MSDLHVSVLLVRTHRSSHGSMKEGRSLPQQSVLPKDCTLNTALDHAHFKLYTAHCTLHTAHCTLHTAHCTLHTAYCTLHTVHCALYTVHYTLHTCPWWNPECLWVWQKTASCPRIAWQMIRSQSVTWGLWDEMRWDEMRWDEVRWDEVRWVKVRWDALGHNMLC